MFLPLKREGAFLCVLPFPSIILVLPVLIFLVLGSGKIVSCFTSIVWYRSCSYSYIIGDFVAGFSDIRNYSTQVLLNRTSEGLFNDPEIYDHPSTSVSRFHTAGEFAANDVGSSPQLGAPRHWFKNWQELRKDKLSASTFSQAVGFFRRRRVQLWLEKLGAIEPFPARRSYPGYHAAMWSSSNEVEALETYKFITGNTVLFTEFKVYRRDPSEEWLAASPDGVVYRNFNGWPSLGVLEIKCPYFKGDKSMASPWKRVPLYYIPQAQGLMEILDAEWMDLFVWTLNGNSLFRIYRDREYWDILNVALSDFWWNHVLPAKNIFNEYVIRNPLRQLEALKPAPKHELCASLVIKSEEIADQSNLLVRNMKSSYPRG